MLWIFFTAWVAQAASVTASTGAPDHQAVKQLIARAVVERMGADVVPTVRLVGAIPSEFVFSSAVPDPLGRLGTEMTFTLMPEGKGGRPQRVRAAVSVVAPRLVARQEILRGHIVEAADVEISTSEVTAVPVRRLPTADAVIGQKALRPIAAGQVIQDQFVAVRRAVQAGDTVTVVAVVGAVQVTASMIASDSGDPGDFVRVTNPQTHRSFRVRVVNKGVVEVIDGR